MKLVTPCQYCDTPIKVKAYAATRPDLEMLRGETFKVTCEKCGQSQQKYVNDVWAIPSPIIIYGGYLIGAVVTILLWTMLGAIGLFSFLIPVLISNSESNAVAMFNSYRS